MFLTRKGHCGLVLSLRGIDDECLTGEQLNAISHALVAAFKLFDESLRIYQYLTKTTEPEIERKEGYSTPAVQSVMDDRAAFLRDHGSLAQVQLHFVILYELKAPFGKRKTPSRTQREEEIDTLLAKTQSFLVDLRELFRPRILAKQEAFHFFLFLLNLDCERAKRIPLKTLTMVDYQVVARDLNWDKQGRLSCDDRHIKILSLKNCHLNHPNLFRSLVAIPYDFILWTEWKGRRTPLSAKPSPKSGVFSGNSNAYRPARCLQPGARR